MSNRKEAKAIVEEHRSGGCIAEPYLCTIDLDIHAALDAAERRGEERVLRWMRARGWDGAIVDYKQLKDEYRKARRARGDK